MKFREWLWGFLPDQCEVTDCCSKGVRGNEIVNYPWPERYADLGIVMCNYCNTKYMQGDVLYVEGNMPLIVRGSGVVKSFNEAQRRKRRTCEDKV